MNKLFNKEGWLKLLEKYKGILPITIKAIKEGTEVPEGNVLMILENNDPEFPWLTNYIETYLLKIWYPITIATNSFYCRRLIKESVERTSGNLAYVDFALHDFGYRGVSCEEQAGIGGSAHLTSFYGTDNLKAIVHTNKYYNKNISKLNADNYKEIFKMYGYSIAASEHSTATPFGKDEGEKAYIQHMLEAYKEAPFSIVIDSFDALDFPNKLKEFKGIIDQRENKVILRPDSGNPIDINLKLLNILWNEFGGTYINDFKLLNSKIGIIQGDGIDYQMIKELLIALENQGWATDNLVFGSGGGLLQKFNRDTQRFAIKCCKTIYNGESVNVQKNPSTDSSKASKTGDLKLHKVYSGAYIKPNYITISSAENTPEQFAGYVDELQVVFYNGKCRNTVEFEEIRELVNKQL